MSNATTEALGKEMASAFLQAAAIFIIQDYRFCHGIPVWNEHGFDPA